MAKTWSLHSPSNWFFQILIIVPRDVPCKISHCLVYPVAPFPRNGQNMALLWPKNGPHLVLQIGSSWIIINLPREAPCQISQFWVYPIVPSSWKWPKYGPFMAKTWSTHSTSNWFSLNHNKYALGCSMPNFRVLSSILTDIFNFLTYSVSKSLSK